MSTSGEFILKYSYDPIVQGCNTVEVSSHLAEFALTNSCCRVAGLDEVTLLVVCINMHHLIPLHTHTNQKVVKKTSIIQLLCYAKFIYK